MSRSISMTSSPPHPAPISSPRFHPQPQPRQRHSVSTPASPSSSPLPINSRLAISPLTSYISLSPTSSAIALTGRQAQEDHAHPSRDVVGHARGQASGQRARSNTTDMTPTLGSLNSSSSPGTGSTQSRRLSGDAAIGRQHSASHYSNANTITSPGRGNFVSASASTSTSTSRYSPRLGGSSKSAPTSPSGRITLTGLTPINQITPSQLDGTISTSPSGTGTGNGRTQQQLVQSYFPYQQPQAQAQAQTQTHVQNQGAGSAHPSVPQAQPVSHDGQVSYGQGGMDVRIGQSGPRAHVRSPSQSQFQSHNIANQSAQPSLLGTIQQQQQQHQQQQQAQFQQHLQQQQQHRPIQFHSKSLPPTHPIHSLPSPSFHPAHTSQSAAGSTPIPSNRGFVPGTNGHPPTITSVSAYPHAGANAAAGPSRPAFNNVSSSSHTISTKPLPPTTTTTTAVAHARVRRNNTLSRSGEDSGIDSDATVRPKTGNGGAKGSLSQPDLTALRSKRVEGWADSVMSANSGANPIPAGTEERRASIRARTKTPPSRPVPIPHTHSQPQSQQFHQSNEAWLPASPTNSRSHPSLSGLRKSPSPRNSALSIPTMSPINARTPLSSSSDEDGFRPFPPLASHRSFTGLASGFGGMSSEDADDDYESTDSPSSGSITFSPKRTRGSGNLRQRFPFPIDKDKDRPRFSPVSSSGSGLGLSLGPTSSATASPAAISPKSLASEEPDTTHLSYLVKMGVKMESWFQHSSLLSLRLLAIVPSLWGIAVLSRALVTGGIWFDIWPWGVDLSREALERVVAGGGWNEGTWRTVRRGDVLLSIAWAICTAHFCFSLTTGLTHRWRSYYSLPSTLTRLLSLQCLCWPATYLTLWILGAERILLCWVVIGVTTGWSRTVQMWVTSNVVPADYHQRHRRSSALPHDDNAPGEEDVGSEAGTPAGGAGGGLAGAGDVTPNLRTIRMKGPPEVPEGLGFWDTFKWGRKWDWDNVAREVGWKVGALLLVTNAWLFWGIEEGKVLRL
ncbi:hypothetical protein IAU59_000327 [Kwoniella sp. CBS 9459]